MADAEPPTAGAADGRGRSAAHQSTETQSTLVAADIFHAATDEFVEQLRSVEWDAGDPLIPLLARTVMCRQHDYLSAATGLARQGRGWAIVSLLRPACEELIWLSVLASTDEPARERIAVGLGRLDTALDITAQERFLGRAAMEELGYAPSFLSHVDASRRELRKALSAEFKELGFPMRGNEATPSVAALADRADMRRLYDFIYHASSTAVHFKPGQLMRGVWGSPGAMRVDLAPVEARLADFGLYWCVRLALDTFLVGLQIVEVDESDGSSGIDEAGVKRAGHLLSDGQRPFVLPDEVYWPNAKS